MSAHVIIYFNFNSGCLLVIFIVKIGNTFFLECQQKDFFYFRGVDSVPILSRLRASFGLKLTLS